MDSPISRAISSEYAWVSKKSMIGCYKLWYWRICKCKVWTYCPPTNAPYASDTRCPVTHAQRVPFGDLVKADLSSASHCRHIPARSVFERMQRSQSPRRHRSQQCPSRSSQVSKCCLGRLLPRRRQKWQSLTIPAQGLHAQTQTKQTSPQANIKPTIRSVSP